MLGEQKEPMLRSSTVVGCCRRFRSPLWGLPLQNESQYFVVNSRSFLGMEALSPMCRGDEIEESFHEIRVLKTS